MPPRKIPFAASKRTTAPTKKSTAAKSKATAKSKAIRAPSKSRNRLAGFCLHSNEELQTWIARIEDVREELDEMLVAAGEKPLGVDLASLDRLERFLLRRYPTMDAALTLAERAVVDAASRQVGLILKLATNGSTWALNLDKPNEMYYRLPMVRFADGMCESPLTMITASLSRRTGTFMRSVAEAFIEDYGD